MGRGSKQTAKEDILMAARKLLMQDGSSGTSMRDIAAELGISVGNLTYYYKTKIELMEDVVLDLHKNMVLKPAPKDLFELDGIFRIAENKHSGSLYYFRNYARFAAESKKIRKLQTELWHKHRENWREIMLNLRSAELIQPEEYDGQTELFIDSMQFMILFRNSRDEMDGYMELKAPALTDCMWSLFFPLLTEKGKLIYLNDIKKHSLTNLE